MLPVYSNGIGSDVNPRCPALRTFCCTGMIILHCLVYAAMVAITRGVHMGGGGGGGEMSDKIEKKGGHCLQYRKVSHINNSA